MNIINYIENLSEEEIQVVGTKGQVAIEKDGESIAFFDTVEEAQTYIDNYTEESTGDVEDGTN